jgi:hypothetical protein
MTFFLVILGFFAVLPLLGLAYQSLGKLIDRRRFPAPGHYVDANGQKLHIVEKGNGPAIVFEAGIASSCHSWATI